MGEGPDDLKSGLAECLGDFLDDLRRDGYRLGVGNYVDALRLLHVVAADGLLADGPDAFKVRLAPLICKTPAQQDGFPGRFDAWARTLGTGRKPAAVVITDTLDEVARESRWFYALAVAILIAALLGGAGYWLNGLARPVETVTQPPPAQSQAQAGPVPKLKVTVEPGLENLQPDAVPNPGTISGEAAPKPALVARATAPKSESIPRTTGSPRVPALAWLGLLGFLPVIWLARKSWLDYRASLYLNQRQASGDAKLTRLTVGGRPPELFHGRRIEATAVRLRRRRRTGSGGINVAATVSATVKGGGLFTPVPGTRKVAPDYLVLVERSSYLDQQARLFDALADRLEACGVNLARYHFDRDPRDCLSRRGRVGLSELAMQHPDHRLLLLSNGSGLLDLVTGEPADWSGELASWPERAILTPEAPARWGHREEALERAGLVVLPATEEGLAALARHFEPGAGEVALALEPSPPYPPRLRRRPGRWLGPDEPEPDDVDGLLAELRRFLGPAGLSWLAACAVYPALEWDLTLYLGRILVAPPPSTGPLLDEGRLAALTSLPWFRHGSMPAWLRRRLISGLGPDREVEARDALQALFVSSLGPDPEGFELEIASDRRPALRSLAGRVFRLVHARSPETNPFRDLVFADFMTGRRPDSLAVAVPRAVARAFRPPPRVETPPRPAGQVTPSMGDPPLAMKQGTRVYLSMVNLELGSARRRVKAELKDHGCRPVERDDRPLGYRDAVEKLRERIAECDAVIHVAGYCYGLEPRDAPSMIPRRSYAQLEYDIAVELGKPVHVFLTGNIFPTDPQKPEPPELRELQEAHRRYLTSHRRPFIRAGSVKGLERKIGGLPLGAGRLEGELQPLSGAGRLRAWLVLVAVSVAVGLVVTLGPIGFYEWRRSADERAHKEAMDRQLVLFRAEEPERRRRDVARLLEQYNRDEARRLKELEDSKPVPAAPTPPRVAPDATPKEGGPPAKEIGPINGREIPPAPDSGVSAVDPKRAAFVKQLFDKMNQPAAQPPAPSQSIQAPPPEPKKSDIPEPPIKADENSVQPPATAIPPADAFLGSSRKQAKTSIADSKTIESAAWTGELLDSVLAGEAADVNDQRMRLKLGDQSPRVAEERRNVKVVAFAYAVQKAASNDFHLVIGGPPEKGNPHHMFAVISGLPDPPNASTPVLTQVRDQFRRYFAGSGIGKDVLDTKRNSSLYSVFNPPIPVIIEGSLFFNTAHRPGQVGPRSLRVETSWEIRPVTSLKFP